MPECMPGSTIRLFPLNIVCDFDLFVAHHEVVHCLYGRFPLKEHGVDLFDDGQGHAVFFGESQGSLCGIHALHDHMDLLHGLLHGASLTDEEARAPVTGMDGRAGNDQIADPGKPEKRLHMPAHFHAEHTDFLNGARNQRGLGAVAASNAVRDTRGQCHDVLERCSQLNPEHIGAGVNAEYVAHEHVLDILRRPQRGRKARPLCDVRSQRGRFPSPRPTAGMPAAARTAGRRPTDCLAGFDALLSDIEDVVADSFEVGEQLREDDAALVGAGAAAHAVELAIAVFPGHIVDFLFQIRNAVKPAIHVHAGIGFQQIDGLEADILHTAQLRGSLIGETDIFLFEELRIFADVNRVVADSLDVAGDQIIGTDGGGIALVRFVDDHVGNIAADLAVEEVQVFLRLLRFSQILRIRGQNGLKGHFHVLTCHAEHPVNFLAQLVDIHRGETDRMLLTGQSRAGNEIGKVHSLRLVFGAIGKNAHGNLHHQRARRQENEGGDNVKERVHIRDLRIRASGRQRRDQVGERRRHADDREQNGAEHVEHQVDNGGALRVAGGSHGSEQRRDAGADVLAEEDVNSGVDSDNTADSQRLQDTDGGRGRLNDSREERAGQDADKRIREGADKLNKGGPLAQRLHRRAHHFHTDKEHAETGENAAVMVYLRLFEKDDKRHAHKGKQRSELADVEGDQLARDRGADVRAHDDPDSLPQRHHSGVNEADHHDGRGRGGLNRRRDARAHQDAEEAVRREALEDLLHAVAGRGFQTGAHHLHAVEEQRQAAQQPEENTHIKHCIPPIFAAAPRIARSAFRRGLRPPLPCLYTFFSYAISISNL